jgi:2-desacetyl-2-hydroxyethyl bacteriochlorophyllide A dehydrogenase
MKGSSSRESLYFVAPNQVAVVEEPLAAPSGQQMLVETVVSAISPGTELLVYRGEVPAGMPLDASIAGLTDSASFPVKYGYSAVGKVIAVGGEVTPDWLGRTVFSFHPHESHFLACARELVPLPEGVAPEDAALFPNVETAVTLMMDGRPLIGENVAVFGQGIVGLLTTALLARFPLSGLVTFDLHPRRRRLSMKLGAHEAVDPAAQLDAEHRSFDLTYELSGNPAALDQAIAVTGFHGRVVIGSWYGERRARLHLGGSFHRSRIQLVSSQVSTIDPTLTGRWSPDRRRRLTWTMLSELKPARLVTHRLPFSAAAEAYELLDRHPHQTIQVLLTYGA